jgi:hypothetical protein
VRIDFDCGAHGPRLVGRLLAGGLARDLAVRTGLRRGERGSGRRVARTGPGEKLLAFAGGRSR